MSERILLVDSDMFVLLSGAGVLETIANLLGFELKNVRRLDALPYQLRKSRKFRKNYSKSVLDRALALCQKVPSLLDRPTNDDALQRLATTDKIDEGEAVMFGVMAEQELYLLAPGDKVAMRALAKGTGLEDIKRAVSGRIICLESVVRLLVKSVGTSKTAAAFTPLRDGNVTLRVLFSRGELTTEEDCLAGIASYLNELIQDVGDNFLLIPEVKPNGTPE
jgi:hypothetical protein